MCTRSAPSRGCDAARPVRTIVSVTGHPRHVSQEMPRTWGLKIGLRPVGENSPPTVRASAMIGEVDRHGIALRNVRVGVDEVENERADIVAPAATSKDTVMPGTGFHMAGFLAVGQAGAEIECRNALTRRGNIVLRTLDGFHRDLGDRADIDL